MNLDEVFKRTTKEKMIQYYIREYERQRLYIYPICCQLAKRKVETSFTILDLKDGSMSLLSPSVQGFTKIATGICQDYYPETLGKMYILNVSWVIKAGWWVVKAFLDEKTVTKINIMGSDYIDELQKYVDAENIPSFLGGKCNCPNGCLKDSHSPWKSTYDKFPKETDPPTAGYPPIPEKWKPS